MKKSFTPYPGARNEKAVANKTYTSSNLNVSGSRKAWENICINECFSRRNDCEKTCIFGRGDA